MVCRRKNRVSEQYIPIISNFLKKSRGIWKIEERKNQIFHFMIRKNFKSDRRDEMPFKGSRNF